MSKRGSFVLLYGGVVRGWTQASGLIVFAFGARVLGVADFGVFALSVAIVNIVQYFLYAGIYEYVLRCNESDELDETLLVLNLTFGVVGSLINSGIGLAVAAASHQAAVVPLSLAMAPSAILASVAAWHEARILRNNRYDIYYKVWGVTETLSAAIAIAMLLTGAKLYSLVGYRYLQCGLMLLGYVLLFPISYLGAVKPSAIPKILRFAGPIYGSRLMGALSGYGVDLIVGVFISPTATALYRMASRIVATLAEVLFQPLRTVAWIKASRVRDRGVARVVLALLPLTRVAALILWPASVTLAFVCGDALAIGLGPSWRPASVIIMSLLVARGIGLFDVLIEPLLASIGKGRLLLFLRALSILVMLASLIILAPRGANFTGAPSILGALVTAVGVSWVVVRAVGFQRLARSVADGAVAALGVLAVFALGEAIIDFRGGNSLLIHVGAAICAAAIMGSLLLHRRSDLMVLRNQASPGAPPR